MYCRMTYERVQDWLDDGDAIREDLRKEGPRLVKRLMKQDSLRSIAKKSNLSATYLSRVLNKLQTISPRSFLTLSKLEKE